MRFVGGRVGAVLPGRRAAGDRLEPPDVFGEKRTGTVRDGVKRLLIVALVVVVVFTGIPVVIGMPMATCSDCDLGMIATTMCVLAILAAVRALIAFQLNSLLSQRRYAFADLMVAGRLERPPRLA